MEKININEILECFEKNTEINIGLFPNTKSVKYGYENIKNEFKLYLQGLGEVIDIIKDCIKKNNVIHFNIWSNDGKFINGDGKIRIIENEDDKLDGLNKIIKQHEKNNIEYNVIINDLNELYIFEVNVENTYLTKN